MSSDPSPFAWVSDSAQPRLLAALSLLLIVLSIWLTDLGRALINAEAPSGIVSYELAGHVDRSAAMIRSWSADARANAMLIQGIDSLYLLVYPAWFSLAACRLVARMGARWRRSGLLVAWAVLLAAPLDVLENHALTEQLMHGPSQFYAQLSWWCAVPKFALVGIASAFVLLASGARLLSRHASGDEE